MTMLLSALDLHFELQGCAIQAHMYFIKALSPLKGFYPDGIF